MTDKVNKAANQYLELYGAENSGYDGFKAGANWLMKQPLADRLTEEEAKKLRKLNSIIESMFDLLPSGHVNERRVVHAEGILISILGKSFFAKIDVTNN